STSTTRTTPHLRRLEGAQADDKRRGRKFAREGRGTISSLSDQDHPATKSLGAWCISDAPEQPLWRWSRSSWQRVGQEPRRVGRLSRCARDIAGRPSAGTANRTGACLPESLQVDGQAPHPLLPYVERSSPNPFEPSQALPGICWSCPQRSSSDW